MKHRIAVIFIIVSIFILGVLVATYYSKNSRSSHTVSKTVKETEESAAAGEPLSKKEENAETEDTESFETAEEYEPEEPEEQDIQEETEPVPPVLEKYRELLKVNPYVAGWLKTQDGIIDEPVVYTPGSQNYFLHRDIEGHDDQAGSLFIAINWRDGFHNTLIYGHNMKDGTGFGSLSRFADRSYGLANKEIQFDTLTQESTYELFAAFYSQIEEEELETEEDRETADQAIMEKSIAEKQEEQQQQQEQQQQEGQEEPPPEPPVITPEELTLADMDLHRDFGDADIFRFEKDEDNGRFRYYYYTDLADRNDFDYFVKNVKERALYDTGVEPEWGDDLLTLSTCSYQVKNGRFVVVAVRKSAK